MSSFYEDASLVMIPSGYKTSKVYCAKPTDGAADLSFTRTADTATRVGPDGLIEKVRTNLVLQSNSFDTTWTTSNATVTSGQAGYDGTNNAWELTSSLSGGNIVQPLTQSGLQTFSAYVKGDVSTGVRLYAFGTVNANAYFNLNLGTVGAIGGSGVTAKIEAVGGGWYRCSISFDQTNVTVRLYTSNNANAQAAGTIYIQNVQLEAGDIATDYIATTTAAVSVGPVANVPRLDYLNSSCPRLLLEGQRTNLALWSESFDNAAWTKTAGGTGVAPVVTANSVISPDGYQNAETIVFNAGAGTTTSDQSIINQTIATTSGQNYTFSVYLKGSVGGEKIVIRKPNNDYVAVTLTTEWQRFSVTESAALGYVAHFGLRQGLSGIGTINSTATIYAYGAQLELGSYVSSYVNTLGAAVTRGADNTSLNPATLLGATVGSWYSEIDDITFETIGTSVPTNYIGGDATNLLGYEARSGNNKLIHFVKEESNAVTTLYSFTPTGKHKACFVWSGTSLKLFVDGVKRYDAGSFVQPAAWDEFQYNFSGREAQQYLNQTLLFPTALSDADAIALTA